MDVETIYKDKLKGKYQFIFDLKEISKTFETAQKKSCAAFLSIFVMKSGARTINSCNPVRK
jgi:hypothetical protein